MTRRYERRRHFARQWGDLAIIGCETDSPYPEDHGSIDRIGSQGRVYGWWWSEDCPEGEIGSAPLAELTEITRIDFDVRFAAGGYSMKAHDLARRAS